MDLKLKGKTALVTGASIGIGRGIALALAREGARIAVVARRANLLEELAGEIVAAGGTKPVLIVEDLIKEGAPARIAKAALEGLGSVDILINNAGGSRAFKTLQQPSLRAECLSQIPRTFGALQSSAGVTRDQEPVRGNSAPTS